VLRGILMQRTPSEWRLAVPQSADRVVLDADLFRREVQITRDRRKLRSQSMLLGMLIGSAAMIAAYNVSIAGEAGDPGLAGLLVIPLTVAGAAGGGAVGYVVGSSRPERTWREIP
jgi:hypothetical protein